MLVQAQRQQEGDSQGQTHEMASLSTPDRITPAANVSGNGSSGPMPDFYAEVRNADRCFLCTPGLNLSHSPQVSSIQEGIANFSANVARISELHSRSLNSTDEGTTQQNAALLDDIGAQTRRLSTSLKERIQALDTKPAPRPQDARIQKNQVCISPYDSFVYLLSDLDFCDAMHIR